jgi:hypothetical protein
MVYGRQPSRRMPTFGGFGSGMAPPRDVIALLVVVSVTFVCQFFAATLALIEPLRLTADAWQSGFLWQLVTYPVIGAGNPSFWFLIELVILFWFGRDVFYRLGRRLFWRTLFVGTLIAAGTAILVQLTGWLLTGVTAPILLLQGQHVLVVLLIAAFATLFADATIYLFFVLPVRARWFLWIEIALAFMGYLQTKDLAGFLGLSAAVGGVWFFLHGGLRKVKRSPREAWLRLQRWTIERKLKRMRKQRGFTVIPGGRGDGDDGDQGGGPPYVH